MANLKIMYVVHSLDVGGTERLIYDMAEAMADRGIEPVVACIDRVGVWGQRLKADGFKVFELGRKPGVDPGVAGRLRDIITREAPDILNPHQYTPYFYTIASVVFMPNRPRVVFTEHGRFYPDKVRLKRVMFNQLANLLTDEIIGVSEFSKRALVKYEWFPKDRVKVIYNGIKPEKFSGSIDVAAKRISIGLTPDDIVIGSVGRLCSEKNYAMLIRAAKMVYSSADLRSQNNGIDGPQIERGIKFVIVGDGESERELKKLADNLGLAAKVVFLGARHDVPELLKTFDIFALSSDSEGASLVLLEAMASGLPVVATDAGGNPELIDDGVSGMLVPKGDHIQFGEAIINILRDNGLRQTMSAAGRKAIHDKFMFSRMIDDYLKIYISLSRGIKSYGI